MERSIHVSPHIEKTAGTSLQEFYTRYYGPKNVYIYNTSDNSLICADRAIMRARVDPFIDKIRLLSKKFGLTSLAHKIVINHLSSHEDNHTLAKLPKHCLLIHGHSLQS